MWSPGNIVGGHRIVARLRSGGMASLFLAQARGASGFSRHVAIKVVHDHLATDPVLVQMFVDEARLQARIHHPNVVHVEQFGEAQGAHFLVMEYVHGCSLGQLIAAAGKAGARLAPELAVFIAMQTLAGLHAAHDVRGDDGEALGVVHRDISPDNILVSRDGHVKLIDFGVAKARGLTAQGAGTSLRGKVRYMAPEQATGRAVDRRTDVYALGTVLWEMLTMRRRFDGEGELAVLEQVRAPTPIAPSAFEPSLPRGIDAVLLRATAADPEGRPASAQELRRALLEAVPDVAHAEPEHLASVVEALVGAELDRQLEKLRASAGVVWNGSGAAPHDAWSRSLLLPSSNRDSTASPAAGTHPVSGATRSSPFGPLTPPAQPQGPSIEAADGEPTNPGTALGRRVLQRRLAGGAAVAAVLLGAALGATWLAQGSAERDAGTSETDDAGDPHEPEAPPVAAAPEELPSGPARATAPSTVSNDAGLPAEAPTPTVAEQTAVPRAPEVRRGATVTSPRAAPRAAPEGRRATERRAAPTAGADPFTTEF